MAYKLVHNNFIIYVDVVCLTVLSIHLTDIDAAAKITASIFIIATNAIVLFKHFKNKK